MLVFEQSPQMSPWHTFSHRCCLHASNLLQLLLQDQNLLEQRRETGLDFEQ